MTLSWGEPVKRSDGYVEIVLSISNSLHYDAAGLVVSNAYDAAAVRFKVTPGEGNQIVSSINNGYIHVYGTDDLGEKMRYVSAVGFDLTPYLKDATKGEGVLNVTLGTHTFLKVKVETAAKKEGEQE